MPDHTQEMNELEFAMIDEAFLEASDKHNLSRSAIMLYIFLARNCNFYLKGKVKPLTNEQMQQGARLKQATVYKALNELKHAGLLCRNEYGLYMPLQMEVYRESKKNQRKKQEQVNARYNPKRDSKKDKRPSLTYDQLQNTNQMTRDEFAKALQERRSQRNEQ